jgi:hypothetical protein
MANEILSFARATAGAVKWDYDALLNRSCGRLHSLAGIKVMGAQLPPPDIRRWTIRRKAAVLAAVQAGEITREEVCARYQLSEEEFLSWQHTFEAHGLAGLRVTRLQLYRKRPSS